MPTPRIIQIASGKGGVGKTFLSISLAQALAAMHRNVLLFDGDLGLANVDVQLGLAPHHDLGSVIAGRVSLEDAITIYRKPSIAGVSAGTKFDVLAGKSGSGVLSALTKAEIAGITRGLKLLSERYAHIVIDLAAGLDQAVMTLCTPGSTTLVVVTDEPTSLTDAYAFIKLLTMQDPAADIRVVVNFANDREHAWRTHAALTNACRNFLGVNPPLAGFVPRDDLVRDAIRHQTPILFRHPQAKASEALRKLAAELLAPAPAQAAPLHA
ncbi:MAG TPA: AAA family ATPase [Parvibaculum sp.]